MKELNSIAFNGNTTVTFTNDKGNKVRITQGTYKHEDLLRVLNDMKKLALKTSGLEELLYETLNGDSRYEAIRNSLILRMIIQNIILKRKDGALSVKFKFSVADPRDSLAFATGTAYEADISNAYRLTPEDVSTISTLEDEAINYAEGKKNGEKETGNADEY